MTKRILASLADISNSRRTIWSQRINRKLYISAPAKNIEITFARFFVRTSKKNDSESSWVIEILTEFELIVDSYDRAIQRPKDYQQQKNNYDSIAKNTYQKNQLIVMLYGKEVVDIIVGETGATADIKNWINRRSELTG